MRIFQNKRALFFITAYLGVVVSLGIMGVKYREYLVQKDRHIYSFNKGEYFLSNIGYADLPRMEVKFPASSSRENPVKIRADISLEVKKEYRARLESYLPKISERISKFMYRQNPEDLKDLSRQRDLRDDLVNEVNEASYPVPVVDVVFKQYLVL